MPAALKRCPGMDRLFTLVASVLGFLGVALGAIGAHALKGRLADAPDALKRLEWWETAARYHLIHAVALFGVAAVVAQAPSLPSRLAGWLMLGGVALFSGSLYAMAMSGSTALAKVTPFGGLLFLAGWVCLAVAATKLSAR